jgi:hypothetical protein
MGWVFSIALFVLYAIHGSAELLLASGLFAIAGAIAFKNVKK